MKVKKAVIAAAGLGTRFLPATKALPKEMIPVVDKPGIQYAVEEASRAGIEDVLIVTSRGKAPIEDHFDFAPDLERRLEAKGMRAELEEVRRLSRIAKIHSVRQKEPLGFGHAILQAREHVAGEPCLVMVPDEVVPEPRGTESSLVGRMLEIYEEHERSVVAVKRVPREEVSSYGVIDPEWIEADVAKIKRFIEKPSVAEAPSELASVGRYVLAPGIFDALEATAPGHGNEIQLTDGIQRLIETEGGYAYIHSGPIFDVGRKLDFLKAGIELGLRRDDLAEPLRSWLSELLARP